MHLTNSGKAGLQDAPLLTLLEIIYSFHHCLKIVRMWNFSWSTISWVRTEYGDLLRKTPHLVQMQENIDQKNSV